ncbi:hypothetical protein GGR52DRAFT_526381 [Hypoxylon sp. FL1284]|nr:hypothetical protein GGR52DRAFT_526381 [Hypoxylon sp. FL1284]
MRSRPQRYVHVRSMLYLGCIWVHGYDVCMMRHLGSLSLMYLYLYSGSAQFLYLGTFSHGPLQAASATVYGIKYWLSWRASASYCIVHPAIPSRTHAHKGYKHVSLFFSAWTPCIMTKSFTESPRFQGSSFYRSHPNSFLANFVIETLNPLNSFSAGYVVSSSARQLSLRQSGRLGNIAMPHARTRSLDYAYTSPSCTITRLW